MSQLEIKLVVCVVCAIVLGVAAIMNPREYN